MNDRDPNPDLTPIGGLLSLLVQTECPFCEKGLTLHPIVMEIVCSCCDRPMQACPERFTKCGACGGASVNSCHCDLCGAALAAPKEAGSQSMSDGSMFALIDANDDEEVVGIYSTVDLAKAAAHDQTAADEAEEGGPPVEFEWELGHRFTNGPAIWRGSGIGHYPYMQGRWVIEPFVVNSPVRDR